jgi:Ca-activated chloride channel homolog
MNLFGLWWEDPIYFLLLLTLPLLLWRTLSLSKPGRVPIPTDRHLKSIGPNLISRLWWVPDVLRMCAIVALVVAVARPQTEEEQVIEGMGIDVMMVLDMSTSMQAVDMSQDRLEQLLSRGEEPLNRFEAARAILKQFVKTRDGDRVGLVVFGDKAWLKYPLTLDYSRVNRTLDDLILDVGQYTEDGSCRNNCTVTGKGTAIGDALARALARLDTSQSKSRIIVLITDGKHNRGQVTPQAIAREIRDKPEYGNVDLYTFQVGNNNSTFLPRYNRRGQKVRRQNGVQDYARPDQTPEVDPQLLRELAQTTGGAFYESYDADQLKKDMADLEKTVTGSRFRVQRADIFMPFLMIGFALFLLEWLLRFTRFRRLV